MQTIEQIEKNVRELPVKEQKLLLSRLGNLVAHSERTVLESRKESLNRFFADWDNTHSVTAGERPTRARIYD